MKRIFILLVLLTYFSSLSILSYIGWQVYINTQKYAEGTAYLAEEFKLHSKLPRFRDGLIEFFTGGFVDRYSIEIQRLTKIKTLNDKHKEKALQYTIIFFSMTSTILIIMLFFSRPLFALTSVFISTICLIIGVITPVISVEAFQDFRGNQDFSGILGMVIHKYDFKSIIEGIYTLYQIEYWIIASIIFVFSILMPLIKNILLIMFFISLTGETPKRIINLIRVIGAWSMMDVFVVALFVTFYALNADKSTNSELMMGIYFFLGYSFLSLSASFFTKNINNS